MSGDAALGRAFASSETLATVVHAAVLKQYGEAAYEWDPLTLAHEIRDDFHVDISAESLNRWNAVQLIMTTDEPFRRLDAFQAVVGAFALGDPFFLLFQPVSVEEAAWALSEMALQREPAPFSHSIRTYLNALLVQDRYDHVPVIFKYALTGEEHRLNDHLGRTHRGAPNEPAMEVFIDEQLRDLTAQANEIPGLTTLDNLLLGRRQRTVQEALADL